MATPPVETGVWADHADLGWKGALHHSQVLRQELHQGLHTHELSEFSEPPDKQEVSAQLTENWAQWEPQSTMMSPFLRPSPHPQDGGASASPPLAGSLPSLGPSPSKAYSCSWLQSGCGFPLLSYFCINICLPDSLGSGGGGWEAEDCDTKKRQQTLESDTSRLESKLYLSWSKLLHLLHPWSFNLLNRNKHMHG